MLFRKQEIKPLIISILVLTFVFSYNDKSASFNLFFWILNFIKFLIIISISILFKEFIKKCYAKIYGASSEHKIWNIQRIGLRAKHRLKYKIPIGIILPLLITIFSLGHLYFPITSESSISFSKTKRTGRKFINLPEWEEAKISLMGPFSSLFLVFLFKILSIITPFSFSSIIFVNSLLAVFYMLPFPQIEGGKVFFGSKTYFVLAFTFILLSVFLINVAGILETIILSSILALLIALIYFWKIEKVS
tara:strand:+ start:1367 stop:2110 length:744 start_codon:yes stop_codon:yes gene_type:complete